MANYEPIKYGGLEMPTLTGMKKKFYEIFPYSLRLLPSWIVTVGASLFCVFAIVIVVAFCRRRNGASGYSKNSFKIKTGEQEGASLSSPENRNPKRASYPSKLNEREKRRRASVSVASVDENNQSSKRKCSNRRNKPVKEASLIGGCNKQERKVSKTSKSKTRQDMSGDVSVDVKKRKPGSNRSSLQEITIHPDTNSSCSTTKKISPGRMNQSQLWEEILTSNPPYQIKIVSASSKTGGVFGNFLSQFKKMRKHSNREGSRGEKKNKKRTFGELSSGCIIEIDDSADYIIHPGIPSVIYVKRATKFSGPTTNVKAARKRYRIKCPYLGELKHVIAEHKRRGSLKAALKEVPKKHKAEKDFRHSVKENNIAVNQKTSSCTVKMAEKGNQEPDIGDFRAVFDAGKNICCHPLTETKGSNTLQDLHPLTANKNIQHLQQTSDLPCQETDLFKMLQARRKGKSINPCKKYYFKENCDEGSPATNIQPSENKSIPIEVVHLIENRSSSEDAYKSYTKKPAEVDAEISTQMSQENRAARNSCDVANIKKTFCEQLQLEMNNIQTEKNFPAGKGNMYNEVSTKSAKSYNKEEQNTTGECKDDVTFLSELRHAVAARQKY